MSEATGQIYTARNTRLSKWLEMDDNAPEYKTLYGIQARIDGVWHHIAIKGEAALFATAEQAAKARRELIGTPISGVKTTATKKGQP